MEWFEKDDFWREFYGYMFSAERFAAAKQEIDGILRLAQGSSGAVLDLCCGPGRHAVEFARRGFTVTGVDRSRLLLSRAKEYAQQDGTRVEWVKEDMRRFVRPGGFNLACNLFSSFGYFEREEDNLQVLRNLCDSLAAGGVLVMEMLGKERLARVWKDSICSDLPDGSVLLQRPQVGENWTRVHNQWTLIKDGTARAFEFQHYIYSGRELQDRLMAAGFKHVELYGDLQGSAYGLDAMRLVAVARK